MALVQRLLDVAFTLENTLNNKSNPSNFRGTNANTVTVSGLRVSAKIVKAGFPQIGGANITIYGMTRSIMDQLSTLGITASLVPKNTVTLYAGDSVNGMSVVFIGDVLAAWAEYSAMPEVPFHVEAQSGFTASNIPLAPSSFKGSADAVVILKSLSVAANLNFENSGVGGIKISNAYLYGSPIDQIKKIKEAIANQATVDIVDTTLVVFPKNGSRHGQVPLVSSTTGMVGYPNYNSIGITLKTIYNPNISFMKEIEVKSTLGGGKDNAGANGRWVVYSLDHDLESQVPGGQWFSTIQAQRVDQPLPVPR